MKKYILIFAVMLLPFLASAQSKQIKDQFKEYTKNGYYKKEKNANGTEVIIVQEVLKGLPGGKDQIYAKAKAYIENYFKTVNSEIYTDDAMTGVYELSTYYRGLSEWKHQGTINTEMTAYIIIRVEAKNTSARITIESDAWNVRMGQGRSKKELEGDIVKYAPITGKKLVDNAKQTEAFINLINAMFDTIDGAKEAIASNKAPVKTSTRAKTSAASNAVESNQAVPVPTKRATTSSRTSAASTSSSSRTTRNAPTRATSNVQSDENIENDNAPAQRSSRSSNLRTANPSTSRSYSSPRNSSRTSTSSAASYDQSRSSRPTRNVEPEENDDF